MLDLLKPNWSARSPVTAVSASGTDCGHGLDLETDIGPAKVTAFAPGVFRLRLGPDAPTEYGIVSAAPNPPGVTVGAVPDGHRLEAGDAALTVTRNPLKVSLERDGRTVLGSTRDGHFTRPHRLPPISRDGDRWLVVFGLDSGEAVYGLGEKWGPLNRRGQLVISHVEDSLGVNSEISYKNCPFAWSPDGWGLFVHTPATVRHGVGYPPWSHRAYVLEIDDPCLDLFLIAGATPAEVLARYTRLTGRMPAPPPLWSLGVWLSKAYYETAEELLSAAEEARRRGIPADVITLDGRAWLDTDTRFAFEWDPARYPEPRKVTDALHDMDFRLCCWEYPLVSVKHPLFRELADKGWLLTDRTTGEPLIHQWDPEPFGPVLTPLPDSGLPDLTQPEAYAFWREQNRRLMQEDGIDVIKSDFGEQVPPEAMAANGDDGRRLHNIYPLLYNRCVFEASQAAATDGVGLVFGRAGWAGSQQAPVQWGGDPQADWEGMAASIRGGLSWGMSGAPCYATDIGGFYGAQPDAELFVRWTQAAVFCSHMRFHGIGPREPWAFGEEAEAIVRRFIDLRYRLIPYIAGLLEEAVASGLPVMRAMALAFPHDPAAQRFDEQYLLGPDLLVAPVVRPGGEVRYHLPAGEWFDFWTGSAVVGPQTVETTVPLDRIPVFARAGAILPLGPTVPHTNALGGRPKLERIALYGRPDRAPVLPSSMTINVAIEPQGSVCMTGLPEGTIVESHGVETSQQGDVVEIPWTE